MAENLSGPKLPRRAGFTRDGLIVILVFSSIIVAGLSFQQGRTIDSQRTMIKTLFLDSKELSALKMRDLQQQHAANQNNPQNQVQSRSKDTCATKDKAGNCVTAAPQAVAPSKPGAEKNQLPEKSDDDSSLPNPQRLLHSI
ncbi:MAG TPA: hypothetical protein VKW78_14985 [Terriglobales bacterium]|nr:hypothetical protein [Terriglobales bacterium]